MARAQAGSLWITDIELKVDMLTHSLTSRCQFQAADKEKVKEIGALLCHNLSGLFKLSKLSAFGLDFLQEWSQTRVLI